MENNEIMEKLMQHDAHSEDEKASTAKESTKWGTPQLPKIRVITAKYKLLIVVLITLICILLYVIPGVKDENKHHQASYDAKKQELVSVDADIQAAKNDMKFLTEIISNESNIKQCLNTWDSDSCNALPKEWYTATDSEDEWENDKNEDLENINKYNLSIPLSYLQTHSLYNEKMSVDEKKILKNLNEYLIKHNMSWGEKESVGQILRISIWEPEILGHRQDGEANFFKVSVDVEIEFSSVWDLLDFLYNIEKKIIDNWTDRILYKIQTVSYDIIANDEPQITDISMFAYYYHDKDFWEADEENGKLKEIDEYKYYSNNPVDKTSETTKKANQKETTSDEKKETSKTSNSFLDIFK